VHARRIALLTLSTALLLGLPLPLGARAGKPARPQARKASPAEPAPMALEAPLLARLDLSYPGRYQSRTVLEGLLHVKAVAGASRYDFLLGGEVLQDGEQVESFRYRFEAPAVGPEEEIPLAFQRLLPPGDYKLVLSLEDSVSHREARIERALSVPESSPPPAPAGLLAEAEAALGTGDSSIRIRPPQSQLLTGMVRFEAAASADVAKVTFLLDGRPALTKGRPPFSVELDLGAIPRPRSLAATAFDGSGRAVAHDEIVVNAAPSRFRVALTEPRKGQIYKNSLLARVEVASPDGEGIDHVEIFLDERRVVTLFQPPWTQPIVLPVSEPPSYVRAVAYLTDGGSSEDLVFVDSPDPQADRRFVDLYASARDGEGRPVTDLTARDVAVSEDGVPQRIARFERVADLPLHVAVALDVSTAMANDLAPAGAAAVRFLRQMLQPKDRAAVVTFNDSPFVAVEFTADLDGLGVGVTGLKTSGHAALWDAAAFTLFYFNGVKGQRAIVLISDGKNEGSRFRYEDALDHARRAGVTLYAIGLGNTLEQKKLEEIAEATGGRAFFAPNAQDSAALDAIYTAIRDELRSQYRIGYPSIHTGGTGSGGGFRAVELKTSRSGVTFKAARGYYP